MIRKLNIKRGILFIIIGLWMILIFSLSAQTATQSSELSGGLIDKILNIFNRELSEFEVVVIDFMQFIIRKSAHMFLYIILAILIFSELSLYSIKKHEIFTAVISISYAITDEIHQYFVPGRSCEIRDVLIDSIGVIIGIVIVRIARKLTNKTNQITIDKTI